MQHERTFTHNGVTVTVHRARIRDRVARDIIIQKLQRAGVGDAFERYTFANLLSQSEVDGLPWGTSLSSDAELAVAFDAVMNSEDTTLYEKWDDELRLVNSALNDAALLPPDATDPPKVEADESAATSSSEAPTE